MSYEMYRRTTVGDALQKTLAEFLQVVVVCVKSCEGATSVLFLALCIHKFVVRYMFLFWSLKSSQDPLLCVDGFVFDSHGCITYKEGN